MWRQSSKVNPLITGSNGYPCLAAGKGLECGEAVPADAFMLSPRGELRTTALGGTGDLLTSGGHRVKLEESCMTRQTPFPT